MESRIYDRYLRTEVMSPNEVRGKVGLPETKGGDEVLPFPTKIKKEGAGAPIGNSNNASSNPPKSRTDAGEIATGSREAGDQAERGQNQDSGENPES